MRTPRIALRPILLTAASIAVTSAAACSNTAGGAGDTGFVQQAGSAISAIAASQRQTAPQLAGMTLDGKQFSLNQFRDDVVVVNVWGSWCTPCRIEAPALEETYQKYQDKGVRFLGINVRDDNASARAFDTQFRIAYPSLQDPNEIQVLAFKSVLPPATIPSTVIIDRHGKVAVRILGAVTEPQLAQQLDDVLAER